MVGKLEEIREAELSGTHLYTLSTTSGSLSFKAMIIAVKKFSDLMLAITLSIVTVSSSSTGLKLKDSRRVDASE